VWVPFKGRPGVCKNAGRACVYRGGSKACEKNSQQSGQNWGGVISKKNNKRGGRKQREIIPNKVDEWKKVMESIETWKKRSLIRNRGTGGPMNDKQM